MLRSLNAWLNSGTRALRSDFPSRRDWIWALGELGAAAVLGAVFGMIVAWPVVWYVYGY